MTDSHDNWTDGDTHQPGDGHDHHGHAWGDGHGHGHHDHGWGHGHGHDHHDHHADDGWGGGHDHHDQPTLAANEVEVHADGSLSVHGAYDHDHHALHPGDAVDVRLPNGDHLCARVTTDDHGGFRAEVDADHARAFLHHLPYHLAEVVAEAGLEYLLHAEGDVLCHGTVVGTSGGYVLLGGGEPGAVGSPVFDEHGQLVGQVTGFDETAGHTLMTTAEELMSNLADFAAHAAEAVVSAIVP